MPSSWPGPGNTGPTNEAALQASGSITTSHDGQVIENLEVTGMISVEHDNVTIRNVRVNVTGRYGIAVPHTLHSEVHGLLIEDVELAGVSGERSACLVHYGRWTARRLNVHGCADGVKMLGGQVLEDSWIHDLRKIEDSHNDGIQAQNGAGSVIRGNNIVNPLGQTSALMIQTNFGPMDNWVVEGNRLAGGGYTVYIQDKGNGHGAPTNVVVRDNVWVKDSGTFGPLVLDEGAGLVWECNSFSDGTPFVR